MPSSGRFANKHVMITGGARGIGFDIAKHFAREGAVLSVLDFNKNLLEKSMKVLRQMGNAAYSFHVDVSQRQAVNDAVASAENIQ